MSMEQPLRDVVAREIETELRAEYHYIDIDSDHPYDGDWEQMTESAADFALAAIRRALKDHPEWLPELGVHPIVSWVPGGGMNPDGRWQDPTSEAG